MFFPDGDLFVYHQDNSSHTYTCVLQSTNITLSQYELHTPTPLTYYAHVSLHNPRPITRLNESTILTCTYEKGNFSNFNIPVWYKDNKRVETTLYAGHVIRLQEVGMANAGLYCCEVAGVRDCSDLVVVNTSKYTIIILVNIINIINFFFAHWFATVL